jgi:Lon protease-like protein
MPRSPFFPDFQSLPPSIPIFPLSGVVVMPGAQLPLNVFEPRYLNMVEDALASNHLIGMIQTVRESEESEPELQQVGSAGRITSYSESNDGRILMVLTGVCRFLVIEELEEQRGYRRVDADWQRFAGDYNENVGEIIHRETFLNTLKSYTALRQLEISWKELGNLSDMDMVNLLCTHLPLEPEEKQTLLETIGLNERAELMRALMNLSVVARQKVDDKPH